jgi:hypothetical protein
MLASEALREAQAELAHINRVTMMGELTASIAHEVMQPIASTRNNARAAQNFLDMQRPDLGEVREALACIVGDADRARDIIDRIRDHMKKAPPRKHLGARAFARCGRDDAAANCSPLIARRKSAMQSLGNAFVAGLLARGHPLGRAEELITRTARSPTPIILT